MLLKKLIIDFVSSSLFAEEEVALGGGVTLKLHPKPEVDKVSPAMWITASSRIMGQMLDESGKNFVAIHQNGERAGGALHVAVRAPR